MRLYVDKRMLAAFLAILAGTLLMACLVIQWLVRLHGNTALVGKQVEKVVSIGKIKENIMAQSQSMHMYIISGNPEHLADFRQLARVNARLEDELITVIRDARKPLARNIKTLNEQYNDFCEQRVVPLVTKGAGLPEELKWRLFGLHDELLRAVGTVQEMRLADTAAIAENTVADSRRVVTVGVVFTMLGLFTGILASVVTSRKFLEEHSFYRSILRTTKYAVVTIDRKGIIKTFNQVAEQIFEINRSAVLGRHYTCIFSDEKTENWVKCVFPIPEVMAGGRGICNQEYYLTAQDGWEMVLNVDCLPLEEEKSGTGVVLIAREITERKALEEKLYGLTLRDGLTGLYNHSYLHNALKREVNKSKEQNKSLAFMLLDIDNFKYYNDHFGHPAGDELLKEFARILLKHTRASDIVGRYGGDEFGVILCDSDYQVAWHIGERLRYRVAEHPFQYKEQLPGGGLTVSIGIALCPQHGSSDRDLIKKADEAMYHAKRNAKNRVQVCFTTMGEFQNILSKTRGDFTKSLEAIGDLIKNINRSIFIHSTNVAEYAAALAGDLQLPPKEVALIKAAAFLHDIGKLEIPGEILLKPGNLNETQWQIIKQHPLWGCNMLASFDEFRKITQFILHHHERYDGKGYPSGLAGEEIPSGARIITVVDSFDAMTAIRPYRRNLSLDEAILELRRNKGSQFDPRLVDRFIQILESRRLKQVRNY
jgi:diguanylate cyclase (GGDEF)-like protein/PAS domain S-box-containing protein/putative nucleotidyltransferase with HDIG domain